MKRSAIPWTDFSAGDLNFVTGCTPISEGCAHCFAQAIYERHGWDFTQVQTHPEKLARLRRWRLPGKRGVGAWPADYVRGGSRALAFVCDTGDLFHEDVPDEFILAAIRVMAQRSDIDWQVLTKRPHRAATFPQFHYGEPYPPNIWFGVTAENQMRADERIPVLLRIPATVRFVSVEPMLEVVDILQWLGDYYSSLRGGFDYGVDWAICGAESGPQRRPFDVTWAEDLYNQCHVAEVPFFGKQSSGVRPGVPLLIDGREIHEFPEVP
jgi:protein gp37